MSDRFNIRKVLVAPLDWGLGHATRCIPIVKALLSEGYEVLIAAEGAQQVLLQQEFPDLQFLWLKGYRVRYSRYKCLLPVVLMSQLPRLLWTIRQEQRWLRTIIEQYGIDLVISDNRYGLYAKKSPSVFITHQLAIRAPYKWMELQIQRINYRYINQYTSCWVPDVAGVDNLAGQLSHPNRLPFTPVHYIGLLSRFQKESVTKKYDRCIILSGPEPQRSILEERVIEGLNLLHGSTLLVRGKPGSKEKIAVPEQVTVSNHLSTRDLQTALQQSELVICRSGYTTIMELLVLQKKSILVPTPGQTEQEYLAERLHRQGHAMRVSQPAFDLVSAIEQAASFQYQLPLFEGFHQQQITHLLKASV